MKIVRDKIVISLLTLSLMFSVAGRKLAGKENENTEYKVKFLGWTEWNC